MNRTQYRWLGIARRGLFCAVVVLGFMGMYVLRSAGLATYWDLQGVGLPPLTAFLVHPIYPGLVVSVIAGTAAALGLKFRSAELAIYVAGALLMVLLWFTAIAMLVPHVKA